MTLHTLRQEQILPITPGQAWAFFSSPANLNEITPPDLGFEITSPPEPRMYEGQIVTYRIRIAPFVRVTWVTEIKCVEEGRSFVDEQRFGPYRLWHHEHRFAPAPGGLRMTDRVAYDVGWGPAGWLAERWWIRRELARIFDYRARRIAEVFPAGA